MSEKRPRRKRTRDGQLTEREAAMIYNDLPKPIAPQEDSSEQLYPCAAEGCEVMRTKAQGGTTFTVCDKHWEEIYPPAP